MLRYCFLILGLCAFRFSPSQIPPVRANANFVMHVIINGVKQNTGSVRVAVYDKAETFLQAKKYISTKSIVADMNSPLQLDFSLPFGDYAVTAYHDINDDHHLDQNYLGVPTEPYALSNNVNVKWRRPTFEETKISFNKTEQKVSLQLKKWKER